MAAWPGHASAGHVTFGNKTVHASQLDITTLRFCPACLEGDGIFRRTWQLRAWVACEMHGLLLVDRCPSCGRRCDWRNSFPEVCSCGFKIHAGDATPAGAPVLFLAKFFARMEANGTAPPSSAPITGLAAALDLAWFFAVSGDYADGWRSRQMSKPDIVDFAVMADRAWHVLSDWPEGLHAWLRGSRRIGDGRVGLKAEFGPWLRRLSTVLSGDGLELVAAEVRAWLASIWGRGTLKPSSFLRSDPGPADPITAAYAARMLCVSGKAVSAMVASGRLTGETLPMGGRVASRIDRGSVERSLREAASTCGADEVAAELGVSSDCVNKLRRKGLLAFMIALDGGRRVHRYRSGAAAGLVSRLTSVAIPGSFVECGREGVRLTEITVRRQIRLDIVLDGILAGRLECWFDEGCQARPALARFKVQLSQAAAMNACEPTLSVREAASRLHVSVRMIPLLVTAGCLATASRTSDSAVATKRNVLQWSVESFGRRFLLSRDIASLWDTSCKAVVAEMTLRGTVPVVTSDSARGISAVWRLADAASRR